MVNHIKVLEAIGSGELSDALLKLEVYARKESEHNTEIWARRELEGYSLGLQPPDYRLKNIQANRELLNIAMGSGEITRDYIWNQIYITDDVSELEEKLESEQSMWVGNSLIKPIRLKKLLRDIRNEAKRQFYTFAPRIYKTPDFESILQDEDLPRILRERWEEANLNFSSGAYLSTIMMLGSVLEGVLLDKVLHNQEQANRAKSAPKKKNSDWSLNSLINVSRECKWISSDIKNFSNALKEYRNLIHPKKQRYIEVQNGKINLNQDICKVSFEIVQATISSLVR